MVDLNQSLTNQLQPQGPGQPLSIQQLLKLLGGGQQGQISSVGFNALQDPSQPQGLDLSEILSQVLSGADLGGKSGVSGIREAPSLAERAISIANQQAFGAFDDPKALGLAQQQQIDEAKMFSAIASLFGAQPIGIAAQVAAGQPSVGPFDVPDFLKSFFAGKPLEKERDLGLTGSQIGQLGIGAGFAAPGFKSKGAASFSGAGKAKAKTKSTTGSGGPGSGGGGTGGGPGAGKGGSASK